MTDRETRYHRLQYYELLKVHGIEATITPIKRDNHEEAYNFYSDVDDPVTSYNESFNTWVAYNERPNIKTLKALGWYIETDQYPILITLPVAYMDVDGVMKEFAPVVDDKISITVNPIDNNSSTRDFLITDFQGQGFPNVIYHVCKVVPYRVDSK